MRIASENGDVLEGRVVGYQFPDAEDTAKRHSWHMLEGEAVVADVSWQFRWQALTCDESQRVAPWFGRWQRRPLTRQGGLACSSTACIH
jgi:hypothetical protein